MTLKFNNLRKQYGNNIAINDVSIDFSPGKIHGVIGPNGAGKSTLINMTAGSYTVSGGTISLDHKIISGLKKHQIANSGIARTYQNIRLFDQMSVLENLEVCFYAQEVNQAWKEILLPSFASKRTAKRRAACMELLAFFNLQGYAEEEAASLPYGRQRMLEIARALVTNPRVLLLDEPAAGLNHHETAELTAKLDELRTPERIIIVVEHDMDLVMTVCDRIVVMHHGKLLFHGSPAEVQANSEVQLAYLGTANDINDIKASAQDRRSKLGLQTRRRA